MNIQTVLVKGSRSHALTHYYLQRTIEAGKF